MKHLFFTPLLIVFSLQQYAMNDALKPIKIPTNIHIPSSILCIPDNIAVISGKIHRNNYGCSLYNVATKATHSLITDFLYPLHTAIHPNKKMIALRTFDSQLTIYDTKTFNEIAQTTFNNHFKNLVFNPHDDTIFVINNLHTISSFNYKNKSRRTYNLRPINISQIAIHPTEQELLIITAKNQSDNSHIIIKTINDDLVFQKKDLHTAGFIDDCKYSPDGSLIVVNNNVQGCFVLHPESDERHYLEGDVNTLVCSMVFHPTSFILATLSYKNNFPWSLCYWNTKTQQLITSMLLELSHEEAHDNFKATTLINHMDFTCDGNTLVISLNDKCLVLKVPFAARYKIDSTSLFYFFALQHVYNNDEERFPEEIRPLLKQYLCAALQYSLTHY